MSLSHSYRHSNLIFIIGNHEADWTLGNTLYGVTDSGGECDVTSTTMMPMPAPATLKPNEPWWSYDVGMVHFVGMSTEHPYDACSQQYAWIESDLASVNR
jgi:acid phosphatase type 7